MPATTKLFSAGAVRWAYGASGASNKQLNGIPNLRYNSNLAEVMEACGLNIDPDFLACAESTPAFECDFVELGSFLGIADTDPFGFFNWGDVGTTGNSFQAQLAQFEKFRGRFSQASVKHLMFSANRGCAYLKSFRAARRGVVRGQLQILPVWDLSVTDIVVPSQDVAGLTFTPITQLFTVGPLIWNGITVGTVTDISFDQGEDMEYAGFGGETWPDFVACAGRQPTFTVQCKDVPQIVVQSITGAAQSATDSEIYLRGLERNKKRYPNNQSQHIKFALDEGRIAVESIQSENRKSADVTLKLTPAFDGTNHIIVGTYNTTIPAGE